MMFRRLIGAFRKTASPRSPFDEQGFSTVFVTEKEVDSDGRIDFNSPSVRERMNAWATANPPRYDSGELVQFGDRVRFRYNQEEAVVGGSGGAVSGQADECFRCDALRGAVWFIPIRSATWTAQTSPSQLTFIARATASSSCLP